MRTALLPLLALGLTLAGCKTGTIELDDGAAGGDTGSTAGDDGSTDGGTDSGSSDGGDDGGGDDGGGDDGGGEEPVVRDGTYFGDFEIEGTVPDFGGDICVGTVELEVAEDGNPEIDGVATCEFQGYLNWFGPQEVLLTGAAAGDPAAEGDLYYELEGTPFEAEWTGAYQGEGDDSSLSGTFEGDTLFELYGYEVQIFFTGAFVADRE